MESLTALSGQLGRGEVTSRGLVETALERVSAPGGEGARVYLSLYAERARAEADAFDAARAAGMDLPPLAGIPISVKDLFDVAGEVTRAASRVLGSEPPAGVDAEIVRRLRQAGLIVIGKTNMTEFAFSGLGVNPHFGTPRNPADAVVARIPGGSSSGAAVSVATGMAAAAIGTDTGGSCRIPAAFCGVVGFKPTTRRIPRDGVFPLSRTLDSIGPIGRSVGCVAWLDAVMAGERTGEPVSLPLEGARLGVLSNYVTEGVDDDVLSAFDAALGRLSRAGVRLVQVEIPELGDLPSLNASGGIVGIEAHALHRIRLREVGDRFDPFVRDRIAFSENVTAAEYIALLEARARIRDSVAARMEGLDALVMPTVAVVAPAIADLDDPDRAVAINRLCLRNTALANFLDTPAVSIPCQEEEKLPVGFMLMGRSGDDRRLLALAAGLEQPIRAAGVDR
ncbi:amidase [Amaricoccus macauensis]|uniref:amidase n=1 Tax=Amaricoccus macauensis TaxID=57001 RepID=UPI003C79B761